MHRPTSPRPPGVLSVTALTEQLKALIEGRFRSVWVEGELSQVNPHHSGHVYLTLKDASARIDCVVWRTTAWRMRYQPGPGAKVLAHGQLSVHAPRGAYTLIINQLRPAGQGDLQQAFEQLKQRLAAEGLFDTRHKSPLPRLPRCVGVVTSPTGAARRDIEAILRRRAPQIPIILYPAQVQGAGAAADIINGMRRLVADGRADVLIVGRGGGSLEDLWAFNEESLARAIAACPVPIISAVGHETDFTIADLVADRRAATPSEAAEMAVPSRDDLLMHLAHLVERMSAAMARRRERATLTLTHLSRRLPANVGTHRRRLSLERQTTAIERAIRQDLAARRLRLREVESALQRAHPQARLARARSRLSIAAERLGQSMERHLATSRQRHAEARARIEAGARVTAQARAEWRTLTARLAALSPLASLDRGFSVTRAHGQILRRADAVQPGDAIEITLSAGALTAEVTAVHSQQLDEERS